MRTFDVSLATRAVEAPTRPVIQITRFFVSQPLGGRMSMRVRSLAVVVLGVAFVASAGVLHGCGGGSSGAKPTPKCLLTSDCETLAPGKGYVCPLGFCVPKCQDSSDCNEA